MNTLGWVAIAWASGAVCCGFAAFHVGRWRGRVEINRRLEQDEPYRLAVVERLVCLSGGKVKVELDE